MAGPGLSVSKRVARAYDGIPMDRAEKLSESDTADDSEWESFVEGGRKSSATSESASSTGSLVEGGSEVSSAVLVQTGSEKAADRPTDLRVRRDDDVGPGVDVFTTVIPAHFLPFFGLQSEPDSSIFASDGPENFGIIAPGLYRSSYPQARDYTFIKDLKLRTIVTLVDKEFPASYRTFITDNGIRHHVFNMKGTKKEDIPMVTMKSILRLVLDKKNHPLLIHCNHGKHRTGCVVAVVRKMTGWDLSNIVDEYRRFAGDKVRECDIRYIRTFELANLSNLFAEESKIQFRVRSFLRITIFAFCVMVIWSISGINIGATDSAFPQTLIHRST